MSAVAIEPTGAAISWAIVRLRLFDPISWPALKSCIRASDVTAIVPVNPLDDMFTGTLPGEMKAKIACIMFDIALIGPQFVSPSTLNPTNMSGNERSTAINDSQIGIPMLKYWTRQTIRVMQIDPITTNRIGKSLVSTRAVRRPPKLFFMSFHFKANEVRPPATINPVAGHITQRKVAGKVSSGIIP